MNKYSKEKVNIVQKKTRSLLEELNEFAIKKDREIVLESRAVHIIDSAINLIRLIRETFEPETAYELERRLINSIKGADSAKFVRGMRKIRENKETAQNLRVVNGDLKNED
jgi:hypothetical protein